ncbi:hypothetical protein ACOMHN_020138 [Nucella lapillus]
MVDVGAVQFKDFVMINNEKAGMETKLLLEGPRFNSTHGAFDRGRQMADFSETDFSRRHEGPVSWRSTWAGTSVSCFGRGRRKGGDSPDVHSRQAYV